MLGRCPPGAPPTLSNFDARNRAIGPIFTRGQRWQRHARWWIGVVDRGGRWGRWGALCMALDYTFGSGRRGRYRGGFFLASGAPGQHSTGPGLPRAGCLAIWPGAPGAKKKAVLDLPTNK